MTGSTRRGPRVPFTVLAKPTGAACNLDCTYCFFLSKERLYDEAGQRMDEHGLEQYLGNLLDSQPDGPVEVAWQGGEPTLRGLPFYRRAVELVSALRRPGQRVSFALQTNGTLLDDRWGEFLAEHDVLVGLSVDGPADLHDAYRVNKAGRGTHAQAVRGWRVLQRHGVEANVLCTVHAANADHPRRVYRHLRDDLGARYVQLIPVVERTHASALPVAEAGWRDADGRRVVYRQQGAAVTSRSVTAAQWGAFLTAVFDEWVAADVGSVSVQHVEGALGNLLGRYSLCVHAPTCGTALAVEHDGSVYSCDHYVEPGYRLGSVADDALGALARSPRQRSFGRAKLTELPRECLDCPVRWACHGGCPKDRFVPDPDGGPPRNHLCAGYRRFFTHAEPTLRRVVDLLAAGRPAADVMPAAAGPGRARPTDPPVRR